MKKRGTIVPGYKLNADGKLVIDHKARDAKLDLCTRLKKRRSSRVRYKPVMKQGVLI